MTRLDAVSYLSHGETGKLSEDAANTGEEQVNEEKTESNILKFALNLNEEAKNGRIDPIIGRENELVRITQILARRCKNNPILVGESGVGKLLYSRVLQKISSKTKFQKL